MNYSFMLTRTVFIIIYVLVTQAFLGMAIKVNKFYAMLCYDLSTLDMIVDNYLTSSAYLIFSQT